MNLSRRQLLGSLVGISAAGLCGAGTAGYWLKRADDSASHDYELIAAPLELELVKDHSTPAWGYGGKVPGVELRSRQGDWLVFMVILKSFSSIATSFTPDWATNSIRSWICLTFMLIFLLGLNRVLISCRDIDGHKLNTPISGRPRPR